MAWLTVSWVWPWGLLAAKEVADGGEESSTRHPFLVFSLLPGLSLMSSHRPASQQTDPEAPVGSGWCQDTVGVLPMKCQHSHPQRPL